ncbi:MAG TPA: hydrogenase maturation protease [Solirubrobacterales bacterium]|nr:hydrogenase maturation protease [Solirubrobacterales bacterium]
MPRTFVHPASRPTDPAFLREERQFLERQWGVLHVMEREREHLTRDIEHARSLAARVGIPIDREAKRAIEKEEKRLLSLIGIGNHFRRDDAAGLEVVRRLRLAHPPGVILIEQEGDPSSLIEAWSTVEESVVVDAISSGAEPGRLHRYDVTHAPLPAEIFNVSTHALGLPEAVELARELGRLPRVVVYGIEGESFEAGEGLSDPVQKTVEKLVMDLYHELSGAS